MVADILEWADEKLSTGDKLISWKEVKQGVKALAAKYGQKLPEGWQTELKKEFDRVDKDDSGKIDAQEWEKALKKW